MIKREVPSVIQRNLPKAAAALAALGLSGALAGCSGPDERSPQPRPALSEQQQTPSEQQIEAFNSSIEPRAVQLAGKLKAAIEADEHRLQPSDPVNLRDQLYNPALGQVGLIHRTVTGTEMHTAQAAFTASEKTNLQAGEAGVEPRNVLWVMVTHWTGCQFNQNAPEQSDPATGNMSTALSVVAASHEAVQPPEINCRLKESYALVDEAVRPGINPANSQPLDGFHWQVCSGTADNPGPFPTESPVDIAMRLDEAERLLDTVLEQELPPLPVA